VLYREVYRLRVFQNRVLYRELYSLRVFQNRVLYREELYDLYYPPNIIRVIIRRGMEWAYHVARMGDRRGAYMVLVDIRVGNRPLWRLR
jgi:hypothetical protein